MKNIITFEATGSGSGSIFNIASQHFDIVINMRNFEYVVMGPSYYNLPYSRHKTAETAYKRAMYWKRQKYEGITVFDKCKEEIDIYELEKIIREGK